MHCVVLESKIGSEYPDSDREYPFPVQYLKHFAPLSHGEPVFAVVYEPRGRRQYVGWALITKPPYRTGGTNQQGREMWAVRYSQRLADFRSPVPAEVGDIPVESLFAGIPRGNLRNVAHVGRAVRTLPDDDAQLILQIGMGGERSGEIVYPPVGSPAGITPRERTERLISLVERDARFRASVLDAYDSRCAITGLTVEPQRPDRVTSIIEAAHLRPVSHNGADVVPNGMAMTPTLHRLYDEGFFTMRYEGGSLVVVTSPRLVQSMLRSPTTDFVLPLETGRPARLPGIHALRPDPDFLRYHESRIFKAAG